MRFSLNRFVFFLLLIFIFIFFVVILSFAKAPQQDNNIQSSQSIKSLTEKFAKLTQSSPKEALQELRKESTKNTLVLENCHRIAHEIGYTAYSSLGDFKKALSNDDPFCNSGYLHGVIEAYFSSQPLTPEIIQKTCPVSVPFGYSDWQCAHGIGHGIMYTNEENIQSSIKICDSLKTQDMISSCVNGVFMEYFNEEGEKELTKEIILSTCKAQSESIRSDCYLYSPTGILIINNYDYEDTAKMCDTVENDFRGYCFQGIGSEAMKKNLDNPQLVEQICANTKDFSSCMSGATSYAYFHFGTGRPVGLICLLFGDEGRSICGERRKELSKTFGESAVE